jgi:hypothetical protein
MIEKKMVGYSFERSIKDKTKPDWLGQAYKFSSGLPGTKTFQIIFESEYPGWFKLQIYQIS